MKTQNLIMGGCSLDDHEVKQMSEVNCKLQEAMQAVVMKLLEIRENTPMSTEAVMATVLHDFELIIEEEMCEAEDLIREEVPEDKLSDFAILCETLDTSQTGYWEAVKKHISNN